MKISELIQELIDIKQRWSDLPVFIYKDAFEDEINDNSFKVNKERSFLNDRNNKEVVFPDRLTLY